MKGKEGTVSATPPCLFPQAAWNPAEPIHEVCDLWCKAFVLFPRLEKALRSVCLVYRCSATSEGRELRGAVPGELFYPCQRAAPHRARTCGAREECPDGLLLEPSGEKLKFEVNPLENTKLCFPEGTPTAIPQLRCLSEIVVYRFARLLFRKCRLAPFITFSRVAQCPQVHIHMESLQREKGGSNRIAILAWGYPRCFLLGIAAAILGQLQLGFGV